MPIDWRITVEVMIMSAEVKDYSARLDWPIMTTWRSIAVSWNTVRASVLSITLFSFSFAISDVLAQDGSRLWADSHRSYRVSLTVDVGQYERAEKPAAVYLNFTSLLKNIGRTGTVIDDSLRVVELNVDGQVIDDSVPFQYDAETPNAGNLILILTGQTAAGAQRDYDVYFDTTGSFMPADIDAQIQLTGDMMDEGQASYRITTVNVTYYYQKEAGGFSSLLDSEGNDWISFHPWGGSDGIYRGIPNMVHPDNIFHPGHKNCSSSILHSGPLKVTIHTISNNGLWECIWEIYPYYARMTLVSKADKNYWFLYEGTPGGQLDLTTDYSVRSNGIRLPVQESWRQQDIPEPEWVYFEDSLLDRFIYLVHEEDDSLSDDFWQMQSNMTVLGFGRTQNVSDKQLSDVPAHFTIGLADGADLSHASKIIEGAYRGVTVTAGGATALADFSENGKVDANDLAILSAHWLQTGAIRCDTTGDSFVDLDDFARFSDFWNPQPELPGALRGHWAFDEESGTIAVDSSDFGNHGVIFGAAWAVSGKFGGALEFDGDNDYVQVKGYKGVLGGQSRTVTAWIKTDNSDFMDILSWGRNLPGEAWTLLLTRGSRFESEGALKLDINDGYLAGRTKLNDNQWHHIAAVLQDDGSPNVTEARLYVDGQEETVGRMLAQPINSTAGDDVRIGIFKEGGNQYFKGLMDDVRIYSKALNESEISDLAGGN
jgi:hypothetical protein